MAAAMAGVGAPAVPMRTIIRMRARRPIGNPHLLLLDWLVYPILFLLNRKTLN
jgi:hypothetical protein